MVADAVLFLIDIIRVRRPELLPHLIVGAGPRIVVADQEGDRGPGGPALEQAGKNFHRIRLLARGRNVALARPAAVELELDLLGRDRQARRTSVHHHAHGRAVAFAPGGNGEEFAAGVGHGSRLRWKAESGKRKVGTSLARTRLAQDRLQSL